MIPKVIHLTCKDKKLPSLFKRNRKSLYDLHPAWNILIYDDQDAEKIIATHYPSLLKIYTSYPHAIQRADIFRIVAIYVFGGFYMDMDVRCLKSLDTLCNNSLVLGEEKTVNETVRQKLQMEHALRIANFMFGSIPQHPFWLDMIETAIERSQRTVLTESDIMVSTGPGLISDVYHNKKHQYPDINLIKNKDRKCLKNCSDVPSCHFGDYASHLHVGSWRWENKKNPYFNLDFFRHAFGLLNL
ncbi:MAG: glycosyltransferase [Saprospiraceae bacterium]